VYILNPHKLFKSPLIQKLLVLVVDLTHFLTQKEKKDVENKLITSRKEIEIKNINNNGKHKEKKEEIKQEKKSKTISNQAENKETDYLNIPLERLTPGMRQFVTIKKQYLDCIILFRMGDFYETFYDDAKTVAQELEIVYCV